MLSKSLWINRNQPEIWEQAAVICEYQDYLNYQMTGELVASINNASIRWHYRADKGGFPFFSPRCPFQNWRRNGLRTFLDLARRLAG